jgi:hypothetical protein
MTGISEPLSASPIIGARESRILAYGSIEGMTDILLVVRAWPFFRQSCITCACLTLGLTEPSVALVSGSSSIWTPTTAATVISPKL